MQRKGRVGTKHVLVSKRHVVQCSCPHEKQKSLPNSTLTSKHPGELNLYLKCSKQNLAVKFDL